MTTRPFIEPEPPTGDDPAVYSGRRGRGPTPFTLFVVATFWLGVLGAITLFFSGLWGGVILGVAAVSLVAALLTAG